jgi:hypothetical protein
MRDESGKKNARGDAESVEEKRSFVYHATIEGLSLQRGEAERTTDN